MINATFEKTQNAIQMGAYLKTPVDLTKESSDIRVLDVDGTFTVRSNVSLSGKGIVARCVPGTYEVSKAAMKKLQKEFNVVSDF